MKVKRFFVFTLIAVFAVLTFSTAAIAQGNTVVVTPTNMQGWFFYDDNSDTINNSLGTYLQTCRY